MRSEPVEFHMVPPMLFDSVPGLPFTMEKGGLRLSGRPVLAVGIDWAQLP